MSLFTNEIWRVCVTIPHFGSTGTIGFLTFLAFKTPVEEAKGLGRASKFVTVVFDFDLECQATTFTKSLNATFHPDFLAHYTEKRARFDSCWAHLEAMVKNHDVYHEMSDDHRVWQSGQAELQSIKRLANKLAIIDKERVRGMVKGIFKLVP